MKYLGMRFIVVLVLLGSSLLPSAASAGDIATFSQAYDRLVAQVVGDRADVLAILGQEASIVGPAQVQAGPEVVQIGHGPGWLFALQVRGGQNALHYLVFVGQDAVVEVKAALGVPAGLTPQALPTRTAQAAASAPDGARTLATSVAVSTQDAAFALLVDKLLGHSTQGRRVYVARDVVQDVVVVPVWRGEVRLSGGPGWLFFVDDKPAANWEHPCRFVLVSQDGQLTIQPSKTPPKAMDGFTELTSWPAGDAKASSLAPTALDSRAAAQVATLALAADTPAANRHAVIISGGYNRYNNHIRYWNDCAYFLKTLKQHGFLDANIHVLMADGTDSAIDRSDGVSSPLDLNGDGVDDIKYSATKANISTVFNQLASTLGANDVLYIFTTDHGGEGDSNPAPYATPDVVLYLWDEVATGDELAAEVNKVASAKAIVGIFEQCFSGGLVEKLKASNRVLMSASRWWELSYAMGPDYTYDEFSYYATHALANATAGDTNGDGRTSMEEAYLYALSKDSVQAETLDSWGDNNGEHPAYWSDPWDLGRRVSLWGVSDNANPPRPAAFKEMQLSETYPALGTAKNWQADNQYWTLALPFSFPLGGMSYSSVDVSSNGILFFASPSASGSNSVNGLAAAKAIAPLWDDLTTLGSGLDIYVTSTPSVATIHWVAKTVIDSRPVNMAVQLFPNGDVKFFYGAGNDHTSRVTNRDKTIGLNTSGTASGLTLSMRNGASVLGNANAVSFSSHQGMPTPVLLLLMN